MIHNQLYNLCISVVVLLILMASLGCSAKSKFQTGDYVMPEGQTDPAKILKIVAVGDENYKAFTHFLSDGHLVQAEDYQDRRRTDVDKNYVKIQPPEVNDSFSPDKYLSKQRGARQKATAK